MQKPKPDPQDIAAGHGRPAGNPSELSQADRVVLESGTGEAQPDRDDDQDPEQAAAAAEAYLDAASLPTRAIAPNQNESGYDETIDGLSGIEETIREQAEDHATGDDEDYNP